MFCFRCNQYLFFALLSLSKNAYKHVPLELNSLFILYVWMSGHIMGPKSFWICNFHFVITVNDEVAGDLPKKSPHCKPKPCIAHRELPVSQFSQGKTCFHYREPLFSLQGPLFITGNSLWELLHGEIPVVITGNGFAVL